MSSNRNKLFFMRMSVAKEHESKQNGGTTVYTAFLHCIHIEDLDVSCFSDFKINGVNNSFFF